MNPFLSYEVAKGIVEERRIAAEKRNRWRRVKEKEAPPLPSWDTEVVQLLATESEGDQEMVDV